MDINLLRGISTVLVMIAFIGVCLWAYSGKRKARFDEDALLPFADDNVLLNDDASLNSDRGTSHD